MNRHALRALTCRDPLGCFENRRAISRTLAAPAFNTADGGLAHEGMISDSRQECGRRLPKAVRSATYPSGGALAASGALAALKVRTAVLNSSPTRSFSR